MHSFKAAIVAASLSILPLAAEATTVNISDDFNATYLTNNCGGSCNGSTMTHKNTGPTGTTGTGIKFAYNGKQILLNNATVTITLPKTGVPVSKAGLIFYTLANTGYGENGVTEATVTFTNNKGATAQFALVGNSNIRDWNQAIYTNSLADGATPPATNWFSIDDATGNHRLDMQTYVMPSDWHGKRVVSITFSSQASPDELFLAGVSYVKGTAPSR